jgi:membrane protein YqaA with SNARE-associated domain
MPSLSDAKHLKKDPDRVLHGKWALPGAAGLGFLEGSFVIAPMEPLFIPLMASRGRGAWVIALALLVGNVLGGLLMYGLGALLAEPVIEPFIRWMGAMESYRETVETLKEDGFATLFMIGITPFPYQVGTAAAGAVHYALLPFIAAILLARGIRYFALAGLVMVIGERAQDWIRKHEGKIMAGGILLFLGLLVWVLLR